MSNGDPEGGPDRGMASKTFGIENESSFEVPACVDGNSDEVFPGGARGDEKLKLTSVGELPK